MNKKIRLIELFAGLGAQAKAMKNIGLDFEHYFICEFDKRAVRSYNAIHGTEFDPIDIKDLHGKDLKIKDCNKYTYVLTYSFPCTSMSLAGKLEGMKEGSGTASSLIWEVKRILEELNELGTLPDYLLMENVTQVHNKRNIDDFNKWKMFLESIGYSNFQADLNGRDYSIPQNRKRCFMVSTRNKEEYVFPDKEPLKISLRDLLEDEKDITDKHYVVPEKSKPLIERLIKEGQITQSSIVDDTYGWGTRVYNDYSPALRCKGGVKWIECDFELSDEEIVPCAQRGRYDNDGRTVQRLEISKDDLCCNCITTVNKDSMLLNKIVYIYDDYNSKLYSDQDCCGTITTNVGNKSLRNAQKLIVNYRLRTLTPKECFRLFGFSDEDYEKAAEVNKPTVLYKQIGNSIIVPVLEKIFEQMFRVKHN